MSPRTTCSRAAVVAAVVVAGAAPVLGGCQDEAIGRLVPKIAICPTEDAADDAGLSACDRDVDVGEVPVTVPLALALFLKNPGSGTLEISAVTSDDDAVVLGAAPDDLRPGEVAPLPFSITLPADALGASAVTVTVTSDDPEKPTHAVDLLLTGVPQPAPDIVVCALLNDDDDDGDEQCGTDLDLSFGTVRRTQRQGLSLLVQNVGTAPLSIEDVHLEGATSVEGEIAIASSTRPAELAAGATARLQVVYQPADDIDDAVTLVVDSNDEDTPTVRVDLGGSSGENAPPRAAAVETLSGAAAAAAIVDDVVQVDGTGSSDPEGDPLLFRWSLVVPAGSAARLDDTSAARASFTPEVAGTYTASLVVTDSLGQESEAAAVVVTVRPRFGFRAQLGWQGAGDVDLHVIEQGGVLFGDRDCSFVARAVDFGSAGVDDDDCRLFDDATASPGPEQAVIVAPPTGTFEIWVHLFDDGGASEVTATVTLVIDDAAEPLLEQSLALPATPDCARWHVADVTFPGPTLSIPAPVITAGCP